MKEQLSQLLTDVTPPTAEQATTTHINIGTINSTIKIGKLQIGESGPCPDCKKAKKKAGHRGKE